MGLKSGAAVRKMVAGVMSRAVDYGGSCNLVLSVRWQARGEHDRCTEEFSHLTSGFDVDELFGDIESAGGSGGSVREVSRRGSSVVKEKGYFAQGRGMEGMPKKEVIKSNTMVSPSRSTSSTSSAMFAARRALDAQEQAKQLKVMNRQVLKDRAKFKFAAEGKIPAWKTGGGGFGGQKSKPFGRIMKVEEMQQRSRDRMRGENRESFVVGMKRRVPQGAGNRFGRG